MTRKVFAGVFVAFLLCERVARADDSDADAERLFREAQKLLEERRYGDACPKFEAAYKKDGKLGTLLNLAFCHKEQGATWYAWLEFREAEFKAEEQKRPERKEFARKRLDELEKDKSLAKVIVENPQKLPLVEVDVEDRKVPEAERGVYFTAEEGKRKLTFKAKGKKPATSLVTIVRADRPQKVVVPDMEDQPVASATPPPPPPPPPPPVDRVEPPPKPADGDGDTGSTQRTIGWIGIGAGGPILVAGGVFGVLTITGPCTGNRSCTASDHNRANTTGLVASIAVPVGAVMLGGGILLLLFAPSGKSSSERAGIAPEVGLGYYGVRGTF
jgi:hypothetical protein